MPGEYREAVRNRCERGDLFNPVNVRAFGEDAEHRGRALTRFFDAVVGCTGRWPEEATGAAEDLEVTKAADMVGLSASGTAVISFSQLSFGHVSGHARRSPG